MKTLFLVIDVIIGLVAIGAWIAAVVARLGSDQEGFKRAASLFAICAGALAILFVVATILDVQFLPFGKGVK
jgi:hypothetical protein